MPTPRRAGREARHPPDAAPPEDLASRDSAADRAHDPVRDADIEYLLKEVSAARAYVDIAEASRDAVLARANLRSALRVLHTVDRHLADSLHGDRGSRTLRRARNELNRRIAHALGRAIRGAREDVS